MLSGFAFEHFQKLRIPGSGGGFWGYRPNFLAMLVIFELVALALVSGTWLSLLVCDVG